MPLSTGDLQFTLQLMASGGAERFLGASCPSLKSSSMLLQSISDLSAKVLTWCNRPVGRSTFVSDAELA